MNDRLSTGITGLDEILNGGFLRNRSYLIRGEPGTGKTLVGLHHLQSGIENGDETLFINLGASEEKIRQDAENLGFELDGLRFLNLTPTSDLFVGGETYDVFSEKESESTTVSQDITATVTERRPSRVLIDPVTHFRHLAPDEHQFRIQIRSLLEFLTEQEATVLFTSQNTETTPDDDLQFLSDGNIHLRYSHQGRTLEVTKFRGSDFQSGTHAVKIGHGGMSVYPELIPLKHRDWFTGEQISSGVPELDQLLNGGIERGTVTIISGPSGVGKTTTGAQFMKEASGRGDRPVMYLFEESKDTFLHRCESINIPIADMVESGALVIEEVEAYSTSPEELANMIRHEVESKGANLIMIDGISGYEVMVRGEESELTTKLHTLGRYLKNMGVSLILIEEVQNITGDFRLTTDEVSYLAENVMFLRYLEIEGEIRKAIGVLKKRGSDFERTLREFEITGYGIKIGEPLSDLRGILQGDPEWSDSSEKD